MTRKNVAGWLPWILGSAVLVAVIAEVISSAGVSGTLVVAKALEQHNLSRPVVTAGSGYRCFRASGARGTP